jgi:hypothetical protein
MVLLTQNKGSTSMGIDRKAQTVVFFVQHIETLEAKVKPEGTPTESGGS